MSLLNTIRFVTDHPLNRGHKVKSIIRFAAWQFGSRLVPGSVVYDWVNGSKFLVRTGETGLTGNIYTGLHEFQDMAFLLHLLRDKDLFVDVGANVGSYTILACSAIGARGVAFEPVPSTFNRLVENMRLNRVDEKVRCINKGVGARQGSIAFTAGCNAINHALAAEEQCDNAVTVELTSLDAVLHSDSPTLIKIDVEGYETLVLEGAQETLGKPALLAVIMELNGNCNRYGFDESRIVELMFDNGFRTYSYNPLSRTLSSLEGKNRCAGNTLFVRNKLAVDERLRSARTISIHGSQL